MRIKIIVLQLVHVLKKHSSIVAIAFLYNFVVVCKN